ncbi:unnamed protein product [Closterium sp. Yama58-4]|nr:unnamed protein product [Closterium sp. Yama58-4]
MGTVTGSATDTPSVTGTVTGSATDTPSWWDTGVRCGKEGYDKVLVDAECTHDGSLKHILKYDSWGWHTLNKRFLDPQRLSTLAALQRSLLETGFLLLKPGGRLVYSTCS